MEFRGRSCIHPVMRALCRSQRDRWVAKRDRVNKKIAIIQSNYIPWKGYFDIINTVDEFILYDDVQYTRQDWRNRNKIKTPQGLTWLSIPVRIKGRPLQAIKDAMITGKNWKKDHWSSIKQNYAKAKYFRQFKAIFEELYLANEDRRLSSVNYHFLTAICSLLHIKTRISWSMDYELVDGKNERLIDLCRKVGAAEYVSGPAAKGYIDVDLFKQEKIKLSWMDYSGYPEYKQLNPPFEHEVTIIDLIFNEGPEATKYMKSFDPALVGDSCGAMFKKL